MEEKNLGEILQNEFCDQLRVEGINFHGYGILPKFPMLDPDLKIEAKAIYAFFCAFSSSGPKNYLPSRDHILQYLGISKDTYYTHLNSLIREDYLRVEKQRDAGTFARNIYTLTSRPAKFMNKPKNENFSVSYSQIRFGGLKEAGYGMIPRSIFYDHRLPLKSKAIYSFFTVFTGSGNTAFPAKSVILHYLGLSENTYYKFYSPLVEYNYITPVQRHCKGKLSVNDYVLNDNPDQKEVLPVHTVNVQLETHPKPIRKSTENQAIDQNLKFSDTVKTESSSHSSQDRKSSDMKKSDLPVQNLKIQDMVNQDVKKQDMTNPDTFNNNSFNNNMIVSNNILDNNNLSASRSRSARMEPDHQVMDRSLPHAEALKFLSEKVKTLNLDLSTSQCQLLVKEALHYQELVKTNGGEEELIHILESAINSLEGQNVTRSVFGYLKVTIHNQALADLSRQKDNISHERLQSLSEDRIREILKTEHQIPAEFLKNRHNMVLSIFYLTDYTIKVQNRKDPVRKAFFDDFFWIVKNLLTVPDYFPLSESQQIHSSKALEIINAQLVVLENGKVTLDGLEEKIWKKYLKNRYDLLKAFAEILESGLEEREIR